MKDCRAPNVKRLVAFRAHPLFGDDKPMSNGFYSALRCRGNAPQAPSRRTAGVASWLAATGLAAGLPAVAATPMPVVSAVPYLADSGSVAVQCGRLIDGVAAQAQGPATVVIRSGRVDSVQPGAVSPAGMPVARSQAIHLPARPDRHAHAPHGQRARDGRPQRLLQAHAGGAGRDRAGKRPRDPAGRIHRGARRRHVHRLGRSRPARRDQPGQCDGAAHAGRGLIT